jgi:hypothetical protein
MTVGNAARRAAAADIHRAINLAAVALTPDLPRMAT